ncbi:MAG: Adenylosuccinate lyase @ SAICAR lyase, partial [uncultured Gemmatimonadaceae bacterium]
EPRPHPLHLAPLRALRLQGDARALVAADPPRGVAAALARARRGRARARRGDPRAGDRRDARAGRAHRLRRGGRVRAAVPPRRDGARARVRRRGAGGAAVHPPRRDERVRHRQRRPDHHAARAAAPARQGRRGARRPRRLRAGVARGADPRLHAPAAGAAHHRGQARDALDAGPRARPRGPRPPDRHAPLPWRQGDHGHPGELPRPVRRRPREGSRARPPRDRGDGVRRAAAGHRADVHAQARRAGARRRERRGRERGQVRGRRPDAAGLRRGRGAVRDRADRLVGDGVQAQPDARRADQRPRALRAQPGGERERDALGAVLRAHARRLGEPPARAPRSVPRHRRDPAADAQRGVGARGPPGPRALARARRAAVHGHRGAHRARRPRGRRPAGRARGDPAAQHRGRPRGEARGAPERHARAARRRPGVRRAPRRPAGRRRPRALHRPRARAGGRVPGRSRRSAPRRGGRRGPGGGAAGM